MPTATFSHRAVQLALRARLDAVAGLPAVRVSENTYVLDAENKPVPFAPTPGVSYLLESYAPSARILRGMVMDGDTEQRGLYLVQWFTPAGNGISALRDGADAILTAFRAGLTLPAATGLTVRIRGNPAPSVSQIITLDTGSAYLTVTVPWVVFWTPAP